MRRSLALLGVVCNRLFVIFFIRLGLTDFRDDNPGPGAVLDAVLLDLAQRRQIDLAPLRERLANHLERRLDGGLHLVLLDPRPIRRLLEELLLLGKISYLLNGVLY